MLSTSWTTPAGFLDLGGADLRSYADCAAVRPNLGGAVVPVQGSGVPTAAARHRGTGFFATDLPTPMQFVRKTPQFVQIPQNDGTTLGYHSSKRPLS
jgi:hypothetical protein